MTLNGTDMYANWQRVVPPAVVDAVQAAIDLGFDNCVHPATGQLLAVIAGGLSEGAHVFEAGTGTGAGLAWIASGAPSGVTIVGVEIDPQRAAAATAVLSAFKNVHVQCRSASETWYDLAADLLVLDGGGGTGKQAGDERIDVAKAVKLGGTLVIDDFEPSHAWPPIHDGRPDEARIRWLEDPRMHTTDVVVWPDTSVLVARRLR